METKNFTIVAKVLAKTEKKDFVKQELLKLIKPSRAEEGNTGYNLYQDNEDEKLFVIVENWDKRKSWEKHMGTPHLIEYMKVAEGAVAELIINEMSSVE